MPDQLEIYTYVSANGAVEMFEPTSYPLPNGFVEAKDWLNSGALETGRFEKRIYNPGCVRAASPEERDYYIALKDRSKFACNAD